MKLSYSFLIFLSGSFLFLIFGNISSIRAENVNFVQNPSFEFGTDQPLEWERTYTSTCNGSEETLVSDLEWTNKVSKTGSKSVSFRNIFKYYNSWTNFLPGYWISSNFIYVSNTHPKGYKIEGWIYSSDEKIRPQILICTYDKSGKLLDSKKLMSNTQLISNAWTQIDFARPNFVGDYKITIGLGVYCIYRDSTKPCQGDIFFDDIIVRPFEAIVGHAFEDSDNNKIQDTTERNLSGWQLKFFSEPDCKGSPRKLTISGWTNSNGYLIFSEAFSKMPPGNYSILETFWRRTFSNSPPYSIDARQEGWTNTTPLCQNVTLEAGETPIVHFGNIRGPTFPYFSQKDVQWANQEYDHGNTYGPFFCGTTIAGCGCATTSSAMILKYHGATKAPNGQETNPSTLNNWLKANNGYSFGALKWPSVASYAFVANQNFGTQKIQFLGVGPPNSFNLLNQDLADNMPPILEEPGHFIVATSSQSDTYLINDPAYQNRTNLSSYGNSFLSTRRFQKTNTDLSTLYLTAPTPTHFFLIDSQGRRAGKDPQTGITYTEIPNSYYFIEPAYLDQTLENPPTPPENYGVQTLAIINPGQNKFTLQTYSDTNTSQIEISAYDQNGEITAQNYNFTGQEEFELRYSPTPGSIIEVLQKIIVENIPGSENNPTFPKGNVHWAIYGDENFDVNNIDISSLYFPLFETHLRKTKLSDLDKNEYEDLIISFKPAEQILLAQDHQLCLEGKNNGHSFYGCDQVKPVPPWDT